MTIRYVKRKSCGVEIDIDRKPDTPGVSPLWAERISCTGCAERHPYDWRDVRSRLRALTTASNGFAPRFR
jgi:hypothetical protein